MALYGNNPTATATVGANTNSIAITGLDLALVTPGMTINLGARDRKVGDAWIISGVTPNGSTGGTLTTQGNITTAYNNVPFVIDTTGYLGTDASYAAAVGLAILSTLSTLLGVATNLYSGARQLVMDKASGAAVSRFVFSIAGRAWAAMEHRTFAFTPTGGQAASIETLAVRATPDGTTWTDALLIDLTAGTGDLRRGTATMPAGSTVDLSSAPAAKVNISGSATIDSFGPGRNYDRKLYFTTAGSTLVHSAALDLPTGANIVVRAGDRCQASSGSGGNWRIYGYQRADGTPLSLASGGVIRNSGPAGTNRIYLFETGGVARFGLYTNAEAESGGNAGSNLALARYADTGAYIADVLGIDRASGRVTFPGVVVNPGLPAFLARLSADQTITNGANRLVFNSVIVSRGGTFDGARFTAAVAGLYHFDICAQIFGGDPNVGLAGVSLRVNGVQQLLKYDAKTANYNGTTASVKLQLAANDYVEAFANLDSTTGSVRALTFSTFFSGALLG